METTSSDFDLHMSELKNEDVKLIETQINDLAEIQQILAKEVVKQDENLDNISDSLEESKINSEKATKELEGAAKKTWYNRFWTGMLLTTGSLAVIGGITMLIPLRR